MTDPVAAAKALIASGATIEERAYECIVGLIRAVERRYAQPRARRRMPVGDANSYATQATVLEAHRRFHAKTGCPGRPECYVCAYEEDMARAVEQAASEPEHCHSCPDAVWGRECPDEGPPQPPCPGLPVDGEAVAWLCFRDEELRYHQSRPAYETCMMQRNEPRHEAVFAHHATQPDAAAVAALVEAANGMLPFCSNCQGYGELLHGYVCPKCGPVRAALAALRGKECGHCGSPSGHNSGCPSRHGGTLEPVAGGSE